MTLTATATAGAPEGESTAAQMACEIGWVMALLYQLDPDAESRASQKLRSAHELAGSARIDLERARLQALVTRLGGPKGPCVGSFSPDMRALTAWTPPPPPAVGAQASLQAVVCELNDSMLLQLAGCGLAVQAGYQIGRSLRDTVFPAPVDDNHEVNGVDEDEQLELKRKLKPIVAAFDAQRISTIQRWLTSSSSSFPKDSAQLVSVSLGRWAAFVGVSLSTTVPGTVRDTKSSFSSAPVLSRGQLADSAPNYLLPQGDIWLNLLAGSETTQGLVTPEGYVAAAESALRRSGRIIRGVLWHYWPVVLAVVGVLSLVLGLTFGTDWLGGPGKVWTTIAAAAAALGVSWKGIASAVPKLAEKGESPIFALEELDAMAWALTTLPPTQITATGMRELRRAGIEKTAAMGRT